MTTRVSVALVVFLALTAAQGLAQPVIGTIAGFGHGGRPSPRQAGVLCSVLAEGIAAKAACLDHPGQVAVTADGSVYYAEPRRVRRVDPSGAVTTVAGSASSSVPCVAACFEGVGGLAVDRGGALYISDYWGNTVRRLAPGGTIAVVAGSGVRGFCGDGAAAITACLDGPSGLGTDASGNLYIADAQNSRIRRVDAAGVITTFAGSHTRGYCGDGGPASAACLSLPQVIAVNATGAVFIADQVNRIRKVDAGGVITTIAGNGVFSYCGDGGPGLGACFSAISGLGVDASGNLLIGDSRNNRVRLLDTGGTVSTIAGNGRPDFCGDGGAATAACLRGTDSKGRDTYAIAPAAAPDGGIVVIDQGNALIRRVDPVAVLTTREFAGCRDGKGRLTLAAPAPAGGMAVALSGTGPVTVPALVTIRGGRTSVSFPIVTAAVPDVEVARISAAFAGRLRYDDLALTPVPIDKVTFESKTVSRGSSVTGTVRLECPAGPGDVTVTLRSGKPGQASPDAAAVSVPRGATTAHFTVTAGVAAKLTRVAIHATGGGVTKHATLTIVR